jgi:hypothetical protein
LATSSTVLSVQDLQEAGQAKQPEPVLMKYPSEHPEQVVALVQLEQPEEQATQAPVTKA